MFELQRQLCIDDMFIPKLCLSQIHTIKNGFICIFISSLVSCCKMANGSLTQFVLDGFQDAVWVAQHAGCCRADLNEVFSHGFTQEHRIKCRHFVHSHWRDFQHLSDLSAKNYNIQIPSDVRHDTAWHRLSYHRVATHHWKVKCTLHGVGKDTKLYHFDSISSAVFLLFPEHNEISHIQASLFECEFLQSL